MSIIPTAVVCNKGVTLSIAELIIGPGTDGDSLAPGSVDLLVLPEMALSGYIFSTPTSILPYLEPTTSGPTTELAQALARRIGCTVIAGYPEALPSAAVYQAPSSSESASSSSATVTTATTTSGPVSGSSTTPGGAGGKAETSDMGPKEMKALEGEGLGVGYNSAVIVGPGGKVLGNYRKTFRFEQDKNWAREGESPSISIPLLVKGTRGTRLTSL